MNITIVRGCVVGFSLAVYACLETSGDPYRTPFWLSGQPPPARGGEFGTCAAIIFVE